LQSYQQRWTAQLINGCLTAAVVAAAVVFGCSYKDDIEEAKAEL
jgi:hypothetical protein